MPTAFDHVVSELSEYSLHLIPCQYCGRHGWVLLQVGDVVHDKHPVYSLEEALRVHQAFCDFGGSEQPDFLAEARRADYLQAEEAMSEGVVYVYAFIL